MKFIGYHEDHEFPIKEGDIVTIPKGTIIKTTMPGPDGKFVTKTAGRTYKVKVDHFLGGRSTQYLPVMNPVVRWVGTGGYWHEVDINLIPEVITALKAESEVGLV